MAKSISRPSIIFRSRIQISGLSMLLFIHNSHGLAHIQKRLGHQPMQLLVHYTQMPEAQEAEMLDDIEFK